MPAVETSKHMHLYLEPNTIPNPGLYADLFCFHCNRPFLNFVEIEVMYKLHTV